MNTRAIYVLATILVVMAGISYAGLEAYGQEVVPTLPTNNIDEIPIEFSAQEAIIIGTGFLGGLTIAYLGYREAKEKNPKLTFENTRFFDRVLLAVLVSVPLAIGSAQDLIAINFFTLWMVYGTSLGTAEVIMRLRKKHVPAPTPQ